MIRIMINCELRIWSRYFSIWIFDVTIVQGMLQKESKTRQGLISADILTLHVLPSIFIKYLSGLSPWYNIETWSAIKYKETRDL